MEHSMSRIAAFSTVIGILLLSGCTSSSAAETDTQSVSIVSETAAETSEVTISAVTHDVVLHNYTDLDITSITVKNDSGYEYSSDETISDEDVVIPVSGDGAFKVFIKFDGGKSLIMFAEKDDDVESKHIVLDEKGLPAAQSAEVTAAETQESESITESETELTTVTEQTKNEITEQSSETVPTETADDPDRGCIGDEGLFN